MFGIRFVVGIVVEFKTFDILVEDSFLDTVEYFNHAMSCPFCYPDRRTCFGRFVLE